jgi:hypothetical protein
MNAIRVSQFPSRAISLPPIPTTGSAGSVISSVPAGIVFAGSPLNC